MHTSSRAHLPDDLADPLSHGHRALGGGRLKLLLVVHERLEPRPKFLQPTATREDERDPVRTTHKHTHKDARKHAQPLLLLLLIAASTMSTKQ